MGMGIYGVGAGSRGQTQSQVYSSLPIGYISYAVALPKHNM
jgi:hypothetical protein